MIGAIDRAVFWVLNVAMIAFLAVLSAWLGYASVQYLPIVWDGSFEMWSAVWLGVHAAVFGVFSLVSAYNLLFRRKDLDDRTDKRPWPSLETLFFVLLLTGPAAVLLDTVQRMEHPVPLWLGASLGAFGALGLYFLGWLRRRGGGERQASDAQY